MEWQPIETAPTRQCILLSNEGTSWVACGYGDYSARAPFPFWFSIDDTGTGKCKPTHWMPFPTPPVPA